MNVYLDGKKLKTIYWKIGMAFSKEPKLVNLEYEDKDGKRLVEVMARVVKKGTTTAYECTTQPKEIPEEKMWAIDVHPATPVSIRKRGRKSNASAK
jgi:hypothetical protein